MSTELTKETIQNMLAELQAADEIYERQQPHLQPEKDIYGKASAAHYALMTSAGATMAEIAERVHEGALSNTDQKLKKYGCHFIHASYLFLKGLDCPEDARDFIIVLMAISGGDSENLLIVTDAQIAKLSGLSDRTIIRKRKALKEWLFGKNWNLIEIKEGGFNKETRKNEPTQYRIVISDYVTKFVREWRELYRPVQREVVDRDGTEEGRDLIWKDMRDEKERVMMIDSLNDPQTKRIINNISEDFHDAQIVTRDEQRRQKESFNRTKSRQDQLTFIETRIMQSVAEGRDAARKNKVSAYAWWSDLKRKLALVLAEPTPGYPDPEDDG